MSNKPTNQTRAYLREPYLWPGASLELDEVQWLHGGRRIFVYGTGQTLVQIVSPGPQERRYEFRLGREEVRRLFQLCVENNLITLKPEQRSGLPDEAQPRLRLANISDYPCEVSKWAGVKDTRFDAIYKAMRQLEERTQQMEPVFTGRYDAYHKPGRGLSLLNVFLRKKLNDLRYLEFRDVTRLLLEIIIIAIRLWPFWLLAALLILFAYFWVIIDPTHTYGFGSAILHGFFWYQNAFLAIFTEREYSAPLNTGWGYNIGFFIGLIVIPFIIKTSLEIVIMIVRDSRR
jgi:hypothetical protein